MKYSLLIVSTLLSVAVLGVSCTGLQNPNSAGSTSSATQFVQTPIVHCTVTNVGTNNVLMRVDDLTQASNYSVGAIAPATIKVDCGQSASASGGLVNLSLSVNGGSFVPLSSAYQNIIANPSLEQYSVKATDPGTGAVSTVAFSVPIQCDSTKYPAISLNTAQIAVTAGSSAGYVNISAPAASGGAGGPYNYAIDINGDGRFDDYKQSYWNSASANSSPSWQNVYNLYNGTRSVQITVFDTACQFEKTFQTNVNYLPILPAIQKGAMAAQESYMYIQGDVATLSNSTDPADTVSQAVNASGPFDAMDDGKEPDGTQHIRCNYNNGVYQMDGFNTYSDGNTTNSESLLKQDMSLSWQVNDPGNSGSITQSNVPLTSMEYLTAEAPDGSASQYTYQMDSSCTANVSVQRSQAVQPCPTGESGTQSPVTIILGTFSCPKLASTSPDTTRSISINNGYFYCQVAPSNNCVGGGQSGGTPPIPF
jgi:hypothetical protein